MTQTFESQSFLSPAQVKKDVTERFKEQGSIKDVEFLFKGDALLGGKEFARELLFQQSQGVKISHEVTIKLHFPRTISRAKALSLLERMPKAENGSVRVRISFEGAAPEPAVQS